MESIIRGGGGGGRDMKRVKGLQGLLDNIHHYLLYRLKLTVKMMMTMMVNCLISFQICIGGFQSVGPL